MATQVEKLENSRVKFKVNISPELLEKGLQKGYNKTKSRYKVPGFRPGHAPKHIIEQYYGEMTFFEEAFDEVFPEAYDAVIAGEKIDAVSRPSVDFESVSRKDGIVCIVEVDVKPELTLGEYKSVDVEITKYKISAKDVDAQIERLREENSGYETAEREAATGDRVVIDYSGSVDGVKFDGGTAENQTLDLGSGSFIPGFEEQVVGMKKGDSRDITVTFPKEYHAEELAGKDAVFAITLHEVKEKKLPELDDEFAKDVSEEYNTLADLKKGIKKKLTDELEAQVKTYKEDMAIGAVTKNAKVEIPASMIDAQVENQLQEMSYNLMQQGLKMEDYLKYTGQTVEALAEQYRPQAGDIVKSQLTIEAIIKAEDIKASDEDIDKFVADMADKAGKKDDERKEYIAKFEGEAMRAQIADRISWEKAIKLVVDSANFIEKEPEKAEKKAAAPKKAAAKKPAEGDSADAEPAKSAPKKAKKDEAAVDAKTEE